MNTKTKKYSLDLNSGEVFRLKEMLRETTANLNIRERQALAENWNRTQLDNIEIERKQLDSIFRKILMAEIEA